MVIRYIPKIWAIVMACYYCLLILSFPGYTTHCLQPLDRLLFNSLKPHLRGYAQILVVSQSKITLRSFSEKQSEGQFIWIQREIVLKQPDYDRVTEMSLEATILQLLYTFLILQIKKLVIQMNLLPNHPLEIQLP